MTEETTKEIGDDLEMLSTELQMERRSTCLFDWPTSLSEWRKNDDAEMRTMRNLQNLDAMSDWLEVQWSILRDAGLLNE